LPTVDDYDVISKDVFSADQSDPRVSKLKESVRYYLQGTKEGYSKHFANPEKVKKTKSKATGGEGSADGAEVKLSGRVVTEGSIRLPAEVLAEEQRRRQQIKQQRKSSTTAGDGGKRSQAEIAERIALDLEQLDLEEVVARAAGDFNGDEGNGDDLDGRRDMDQDDNDQDILVENGDESKKRRRKRNVSCPSFGFGCRGGAI